MDFNELLWNSKSLKNYVATTSYLKPVLNFLIEKLSLEKVTTSVSGAVILDHYHKNILNIIAFIVYEKKYPLHKIVQLFTSHNNLLILLTVLLNNYSSLPHDNLLLHPLLMYYRHLVSFYLYADSKLLHNCVTQVKNVLTRSSDPVVISQILNEILPYNLLYKSDALDQTYQITTSILAHQVDDELVNIDYAKVARLHAAVSRINSRSTPLQRLMDLLKTPNVPRSKSRYLPFWEQCFALELDKFSESDIWFLRQYLYTLETDHGFTSAFVFALKSWKKGISAMKEWISKQHTLTLFKLLQSNPVIIKQTCDIISQILGRTYESITEEIGDMLEQREGYNHSSIVMEYWKEHAKISDFMIWLVRAVESRHEGRDNQVWKTMFDANRTTSKAIYRPFARDFYKFHNLSSHHRFNLSVRRNGSFKGKENAELTTIQTHIEQLNVATDFGSEFEKLHAVMDIKSLENIAYAFLNESRKGFAIHDLTVRSLLLPQGVLDAILILLLVKKEEINFSLIFNLLGQYIESSKKNEVYMLDKKKMGLIWDVNVLEYLAWALKKITKDEELVKFAVDLISVPEFCGDPEKEQRYIFKLRQKWLDGLS
ncbi:hypothetical protein HK098_006394 [Nowakowskiella sp. JEL0407]|nr:hypothetical protein HK098_006394 [Nowakowskiella sp. JEL0407]